MEILSITVPIFVMLAAGYAARKKGLIGNETRLFLSKLTYYAAFPALTFRSIVSFDFGSTFRLKLVVHNLTVTTMVFTVTFLFAFLIKDRRKRGSFNMGCFRTNQGYMGLPVVRGFYGEEAMSRAAVVNGFDSPLVIILSVLALEVFRNGSSSQGAKAGKCANGDMCKGQSKFRCAAGIILKKLAGLAVNPFVMSAALGLFLSYCRISVLKLTMLDELLKMAGGMALPIALISVGSSIEVKHLRDNLRLVLAAASVKLAGMPLIAFLLSCFVFRFSGADLGVSVILLSMPSSVSSYVMACEMGADEEVTAAIIGFTTFLSVLTVSAVQYLLSSIIIL